MDKRILVINPGSTSTKLALFQGEQKLFDAAVRHSKEDLSPFSWVMEQADFRQTAIEKELSAHNVDLTTLDAVCARGGQLPYCAAGTYLVDQDMVDFMYTVRDAAHASNLGCVLALRIARPLGIPAFICDPVTVDEMTDEARLSGHPVLPRMMTGHALNCRAMALRCAADVLHKPLADCRLIVLHLGGGGSARLFIGGKMVDGVRDDEWMFAPERMGGVSLQPLVAMCYSGAYTKQDIMDLIRGKGGLMAHLGTANAQEVEQRIADGDAHAKLVYDGMLYSCARAIGGLAAAADGRVDRIILTGGLAHSHYVTGYLTQKLSFIAPVEVMAGEFELEALAAGADIVGAEDLMERIQKENFFEFDVVIATPDMMGVVGRLGRVLGPKGLMPNPKAGTVSMDVTKAVKESKAGKIEYRLDKTNIIHCPIGKASFGAEKLTDNFNALMGAIIKAKPAAAKGQYVRSCVVASTMGPGIKVSTAKMIG